MTRLPMKFAVIYHNTVVNEEVEIAAFYFLSDAEQFIEHQAASHKYRIERLGEVVEVTNEDH